MSDTGVKVFRVNRAAPAASSGGAEDWVRSHRAEAAASVVGLVVAFALYRRHIANSAGTGVGAAAAIAGTNGTDIAGLTAPNTSTSDIENWVQDALNSQSAAINAQLSTPTNPPAPTPAAPAPKPGTFWYGPAAAGLKYIFNPNAYGKGKGQVYQVQPTDSGGVSFYALNNQQFAALGHPAYTSTVYTPPAPAKK